MAEKEVKKIEEPRKTGEVRAVKSSPPWPLITIGIVATVVVLAVAVGAWAFVRSHSTSDERMMGRFGNVGQSGQISGERSMRGGNSMRGGAGVMDMNAIRGVVTAINGDSLTVSGGGKQVSVKKTGTTTISGDKTSVAVNDTVIVTGDTTSDGTVTAARIVIRNQGFKGASAESQDDSPDGPSA